MSEIRIDLSQLLDEFFSKVTFPVDSIFVVGCSTSEIRGEWKGTNSSLEIGQVIVETLQKFLEPRHLHLAIQGCEHINRALLVEREVAERNGLDVVSVVPAIHAGGGTQVAGFQQFKDPVEVEHITAAGGIDIGGTDIGMHVKFVQIPVHLQHRDVGEARVVALRSRPKLIGGQRAQYEFTDKNLVDAR